jgi:hypothetical protein
MRRNIFILLIAWLAAGCATTELSPKANSPRAAASFPTDGFITQRGTLTVRGRQFTLNGYVAKSSAHGLRFIMTENFGGVLADVLVKPDGQVFVLQAKPPFRPAWVKNYIAADLKCLFSNDIETNCPVQALSPTHFIIERRWYKMDLRIIETKPGPQPAEMFDEPSGGKP